MANTTIEELLNLAYEVRDADQAGENTALRVGGLLEEIIQYLSTVVDLDTLQAIMEQYATLSGPGGLIYWRHSRIICLASMGYDLDNIDGGNWNYTNHNGDIVFRPSSAGGGLRVVGTTDEYSVFSNVVYVNNHTGHAYIWEQVGSTFKMVEIRDSSPTTIITYLNTPSFSQVAVGESYYYSSGNNRKIAIKLSSDEVYSFDPDPKKIYVFLDTRQAMVWDAGNRQWISVGGNLIQIINDLTTGGEGSALSAEMGKRLRTAIVNLLDQLAPMAFIGAKPTADSLGLNGYTYDVNLDGLDANTTIDNAQTSITEGMTYSAVIRASSGYALTSVVVTMGNVDITQDVYVASTGAITIPSVTGNIVITTTAEQLVAHTITLPSGTGIVVEDEDGNVLSGSATAYEGVAFSCVVRCANGYNFANAPTMSGATITEQSDGSYLVTIASVTADMTLAATASAITAFSDGGINYNIITTNGDYYSDIAKDNKSVEVTVKSGSTDSDANANSGEKYSGNITIPATVSYAGATYAVKAIGNRAFVNCSSLTGVALSEGLQIIGKWVFKNVSSLESINFPSTLRLVGQTTFSGAGNASADMVLDMSQCTNITLYSWAFNNGCKFNKVLLNSGGTYAFHPGNVEGQQFYKASMSEVVLDGAFTFGNGIYTFYQCESLTKVTFGASFSGTSHSASSCLPDCCFKNCNALANVYCHLTTPPALSGSVNPSYAIFPLVNNNTQFKGTLHVPVGTLSAYQAATGWSLFESIVDDIVLS